MDNTDQKTPQGRRKIDPAITKEWDREPKYIPVIEFKPDRMMYTKRIGWLRKKLNPGQYVFCLEVSKGRNNTEAALLAGYSKDSASTQGSELRNNPKVRDYISFLRERAANNAGIDVEWLINEVVTTVNTLKKQKKHDKLAPFLTILKDYVGISTKHESKNTVFNTATDLSSKTSQEATQNYRDLLRQKVS